MTVSSLNQIRARINFDDLQWERSTTGWRPTGQSKLANLMFTYALQRRLTARGASTITVPAHPGFADTDLARHLPAPVRLLRPVIAPLISQKSAMGALPTLRAATYPGVLGGRCYGPDGPVQTRGYPRPVTSSPQSFDVAIQQRLWAISEELTGVTSPSDNLLNPCHTLPQPGWGSPTSARSGYECSTSSGTSRRPGPALAAA